MKKSDLEKTFELQLRKYRLPIWESEYHFALDVSRKWRFDFAWPEFKLAVELNGLMVKYHEGRRVVATGHASLDGIIKDYDKLNAAVILGWSVLSFAQSHVASTAAIDMTQRALTAKGWIR